MENSAATPAEATAVNSIPAGVGAAVAQLGRRISQAAPLLGGAQG